MYVHMDKIFLRHAIGQNETLEWRLSMYMAELNQ